MADFGAVGIGDIVAIDRANASVATTVLLTVSTTAATALFTGTRTAAATCFAAAGFTSAAFTATLLAASRFATSGTCFAATFLTATGFTRAAFAATAVMLFHGAVSAVTAGLLVGMRLAMIRKCRRGHDHAEGNGEDQIKPNATEHKRSLLRFFSGEDYLIILTVSLRVCDRADVETRDHHLSGS